MADVQTQRNSAVRQKVYVDHLIAGRWSAACHLLVALSSPRVASWAVLVSLYLHLLANMGCVFPGCMQFCLQCIPLCRCNVRHCLQHVAVPGLTVQTFLVCIFCECIKQWPGTAWPSKRPILQPNHAHYVLYFHGFLMPQHTSTVSSAVRQCCG